MLQRLLVGFVQAPPGRHFLPRPPPSPGCQPPPPRAGVSPQPAAHRTGGQLTSRSRSTRTVAVLASPLPGARAERDRQVAIWLGVAVKLLAADARDRPSAARLRTSLDRIERRLAVKHRECLGRLVAWEASWLHVGAPGHLPCGLHPDAPRAATLSSRFLDRPSMNHRTPHTAHRARTRPLAGARSSGYRPGFCAQVRRSARS
jgi:hypothetical protein